MILAILASSYIYHFFVFRCSGSLPRPISEDLVFWGLVDLCSYSLISFWYEEKLNSDAANKAFIINRVGDVGMLIGLGILWTTLGFSTLTNLIRGCATRMENYTEPSIYAGKDIVQLVDRNSGQVMTHDVTGKPREIPSWMLTMAGLGIFAGCGQECSFRSMSGCPTP